EAERLKRERAFAPTGDAKRDGRGGEVTGRILGRLVGEINRSFAYFRSQPGGGPVTRVIITGGGSCLRNIIPFLQRQLNIEVRIAQPLAGLAISPAANEASQFPEQACVVLGLALRSVQTVPIEINLIPPHIQEMSKRKEQGFYWALTFLAIYLIMASTIPVTAQKDEAVLQRINELKSVLGKYDPVLLNDPTGFSSYQTEYDVVKREVEGYKSEVRLFDDVRLAQHFWTDELQIVQDSRPGGIVLSSFQSIVLGGPDNTGSDARNAALGITVTETEEPEVTVAAAPSGGMRINMANMEILTGGGGDLKLQPFPGIQPVGRAGIIVEPNGIAIFGYGFDIETVQEFNRRLMEHERVVDNGVYFHIKDLTREPEVKLDNASPGSLGAKAATRSNDSGGGGMGGGGMGGGGGGFLSGISISNVPTSSSSSGTQITGVSVIFFRFEIQFLGDPIAFDNQ
ncbi:MAG: pilus assembly protein PilM, partial [Candidatus Hydrogenedentota bacterium]